MYDLDLMVVGTGIRSVGHLTTETIAWIRRSEHLIYVVTDPVSESVLRNLNPRAESLTWMYSADEPRTTTYERMVDRTLEVVRSGAKTCFAAYGHPGVFAWATHESIRRAREEGFRARMLPGISAEDCLFADLNFDPSNGGCQTYEASDFLLNRRIHDPTSHLILWQIGVLGEPRGVLNGAQPRGLAYLIDYLKKHYPGSHEIHLYLARMFPNLVPAVQSLCLDGLAEAEFSAMTTLYIPPYGRPETNWPLVNEFGFEVKAEHKQND